MLRKSREVRLQQAQALSEAYDTCGITAGSARFINDMIFRLERKKALTPKQRSWLDKLIEEGVPAPKNPELYTRIMTASKVEGLSKSIRDKLINPFANIAFNGWNLSDAQQKWLDGLLEKADRTALYGPWRPDESLMDRIRFASAIAETRSGGYWMNRPGESKASHRVAEWLRSPVGVELEQWHIDKLFHSSRVALRELDNPSFFAGEIRGYKNDSALILSGPHAGPDSRYNGKPVYEVLYNGEVEFAPIDRIRKRVKF